MPIDFTPDPVQEAAAFDPDAYLAAVLPRADGPPAFDTSAWTVVPATVADGHSFTIQDYEAAAEAFQREGNEELARQARVQAAAMRQWLLTQPTNDHN